LIVGSFLPDVAEERDPKFLNGKSFSGKVEDFETTEKNPRSHLGYRINARFVTHFFGRVFNHPPRRVHGRNVETELQSADILRTHGQHRRHAKAPPDMYFDDAASHSVPAVETLPTSCSMTM